MPAAARPMRRAAAPSRLRASVLLCRARVRAAATAPAAATGSTNPPSQKSILFLGFEWPEPASSAAGVRTAALIGAAQAAGWRVAVGAAAAPTPATAALARRGVPTHRVPLNRAADLDAVLDATRPDAVVFDRFLAEEAFSWRVRAVCPSAARILDMQDCHALRRSRGAAAADAARSGACPVTAALTAWPDARAADVAREWASIARSDAVLVCSPVEHAWLVGTVGVPPPKLVLAPLFSRSKARLEKTPPLAQRTGFVAIGSFLHAPNVDGLTWYVNHKDGWPALRAELGAKAVLTILGSYAHQRRSVADALHRPSCGVIVRGPTLNLAPLARARVLLAPLTYGAGLKGKIVDAWKRGTPVVTTPIGGEGLAAGDWERVDPGTAGAVPSAASLGPTTGVWGGARDCVSPADITAAALRLATDDAAWARAQAAGAALHDLCVGGAPRVVSAVGAAVDNLEATRATDFAGAALWASTARATEYFSRWIELKETAKVEAA